LVPTNHTCAQLEAILLTEDKDFGELTYRLQISNHGIILLRMSGESLENRMTQLYALFENYEDKLSSSFSVVTIRKIRVIPQ
jgi:predicted nuclease of predicted toxin-antitoxin system